jgi:hypothetical protein
MGRRNFVLVFFMLSSFAVVIVQCRQVETKDSRGAAYSGSATCINCHADIGKTYIHNAHFKTSHPFSAAVNQSESKSVSPLNVPASIKLPEATFIFNEKTKVGVEWRTDGLYQVAYLSGKEVKAERIDYVFGSGSRAYTFAYWYGNKLMQMPLNFLPETHQWVNSPGFPSEQIYFGRPIVSRCLSCHSSYADVKIIQTADLNIEEEYVKSSLIAGIDCERCHGPAQKHVKFHQENPSVKEAKEMISYRSLPLQRRIDMCGVCHSGIEMQTLTSTFSFKPGDTLKSLPQYSEFTGKDPDVHGYQKQLLEASPCYKIGKAECISCHSMHDETKTSVKGYVQKCIGCHQDVKHLHQEKVSLKANNCIGCHMPLQSSNSIGFQVSNSKEKIPYQVHNHRIAVYEDLVK